MNPKYTIEQMEERLRCNSITSATNMSYDEKDIYRDVRLAEDNPNFENAFKKENGYQEINGNLYPWTIKARRAFLGSIEAVFAITMPEKIFSEKCYNCLGEDSEVIVILCIKYLTKEGYDSSDVITNLLTAPEDVKSDSWLASIRFNEGWIKPIREYRTCKTLFPFYEIAGTKVAHEAIRKITEYVDRKSMIPNQIVFEFIKERHKALCPERCGTPWQYIESDNFQAVYSQIEDAVWVKCIIHNCLGEGAMNYFNEDLNIQFIALPKNKKHFYEYYNNDMYVLMDSSLHPNINKSISGEYSSVCLENLHEASQLLLQGLHQAAVITIVSSLARPNLSDSFGHFLKYNQIEPCRSCMTVHHEDDITYCDPCGAPICIDCTTNIYRETYCPECAGEYYQ